jgi:FMN-dependent NADH-azoreductase
MSTILVLTSSALGEASVSNQLVHDAVAQLRLQDPILQVITRDLGSSPIPHLNLDSATAIRGAEPANAEQAAARALSDELIDELRAADTIVIGAPMYNFGMASTLKAWFDHVLRAGVTFSYSEAGPEGLLTGKRAIVVVTRGGLYSEGPAQVMDSQEPHLRSLLGFIGITDVTFVRAEKLAFGPEAREQAIEAARAQLGQTVRDRYLQAA